MNEKCIDFWFRGVCVCPHYGIAGWPQFRGRQSTLFYVLSFGTAARVRNTVEVRKSGVSGERGSTVRTKNFCCMVDHFRKTEDNDC